MDGVKHSVGQKPTDLRGEAHRLSSPLGAGFVCPYYTMKCIHIKSKRLLPSLTESVLMPDRKESGQLEARKAKVVDMLVVQFRGLAASLRNKRSREGGDVKTDRLNLLGAVDAWGTKRISWEPLYG